MLLVSLGKHSNETWALMFVFIQRSRSTAPIYSVTVTKGAILFSRMNSPVVEIWDSTKERIRDVFSMDSLFG